MCRRKGGSYDRDGCARYFSTVYRNIARGGDGFSLEKRDQSENTEIIAGVRLGGDDCGVHLVAHSAFGGIGERSKNNRMASRRGRLRRGDACVLLLDSVIPHQHIDSEVPEGHKSTLGKSKLLFLSVTLHNVPEGMAVGAVFAGLLAAGQEISIAAAFSLSVGIALQNFPEGAIISMPLKAGGNGKGKAFLYGVFSGIVEPVAALITVLFSAVIMPVLPYLLSFAAGAMIYVVVEELIPESQSGDHSNIATIGVMLGFVIMMIMDMALG